MKTPALVRCACLAAGFGLPGIGFHASALAQLPNPNQPVLVVQDNAAAETSQYFVPELLTTEGLNGFQVAQLSELNASFLANYSAVVLPRLPLGAAQATLLQNYVSAGGTLVAFRPDPQLAPVFGVTSLGTTLTEAWLQIHTGTPAGFGLVGQSMRFHGTADLYTVAGASPLARLYQTSTTATTSPAAAIHPFGQGRAILFSYDLAQSIALMRQGNPAWAGYPNNHDGFATMRASQMFMDAGSGTFWNDRGDGALNDIPQADEQLRLFSNALVLATAAQQPLPRFWYYPDKARALLLLTGDHHGDAESNSTTEMATIQSYGGAFTNFIWYPFGAVSNATLNGWLANGHAFGIHFDDTAEADGGAADGSHATWAGMQNVLANAMGSFATTYPQAPPPVTTRNHFLIWVSNGANGTPDQTAQAKLFANAGVEFDTSYSSFPRRWGYMNGSGLPMKFLDTATGAIVPVYEQATQYEDDVQLSSASYSTQWDALTAQGHYQKSLADSQGRFNTVVTMLFHPDSWSNYHGVAETVLQYAQTHGIPMPSAARWLDFWAARENTSLSNVAYNGNTLTFGAAGAPAGLTLLVPFISGATQATTVSVDGASQSFTVEDFQGVRYASVVLPAGNHAIAATYAPSSATARIFGHVSPAVAATNTTIQIQGGAINQSVQPGTDGSFVAGPFPSGTYTVTPVSSANTFTPGSRSVSLGSEDVGAVDFAASIGSGTEQTLFTTETPALTNLSDGPSTNYELGTALASDTDGTITAIRFWKASNETGTHVGNLWSSTGQLLASVTFANETASGWQQQNLVTPVPVSANATFVVSVNTAGSYYVATVQGFATQITSQDLHSIAGSNGRLGSPGQFPAGISQNNANYFRDVVFTRGAPPPPTGETLFTTEAPQVSDVSDGPNAHYELGTAFTSDVPGSISAIRFWKAPSETGVHTGKIWSGSGALLASVSFTDETASGWQVQTLASPLAITANTTYVVTVNTGNTFYVATDDGLASPVGGPHLHTIVGGNGRYGDVGQFPTNTYQSSNYFRDVVFTAGEAPPDGETLFTTQTPVLGNQSDGPTTNYELGTAITATVEGRITALRFWKAPGETGTHTGHVWSTSGALLASVTFANETASGWQVQSLATPLTIAANTTCVVSVNSAGGYYVASNQGLAAQIVNQDLRSVVGNNGVFGSPGQFPTGSFQSTNYFRDIVFSAGAPPPIGETLFTTQTPVFTNINDGPGVNYELGTAFASTVDGAITGIRFWKAISETGPHIGHVWDANGQLLATVTFANETASGWQSQGLATPLPITANARYVVSVNTGNTYYVATDDGFETQIVHQNLYSIIGGNGVYGPSGQFPTNTYASSNYFRDVLFVPSGPPP